MRWWVLIALIFTSCSSPIRHLAVQSVEQGDGVVIVQIVNSSSEDIAIDRGELRVYIKGDSLISLSLKQSVNIPAQGGAQSEWLTQRHDPATLYAMSRRPVESYISRLTFDFLVEPEESKKIERRGIKGTKVLKKFGNIENLIQ